MTIRIVTATVPGSMGTVDYTHADIVDWDNGGLAIFLVSGNTALGTEGGRTAISIVSSGAESGLLAGRALQGASNVPHNCAGIHTQATATIRVIDDDQLPGAGTWALATTPVALSNGVQLNWTDVSGVAGRTFRIVCILIDGLSNVDMATGAGSAIGFEPDGVLALGFSGSVGGASTTIANHFQAAFGAAINGGGQCAGAVAWEANDDPATADSIVRTDRLSIDYEASTDSETGSAVSAFTATGFTETGTGGRIFAAYKFTDDIPTAVAVEELSGNGTQGFTGLGITPALIFGIVTGNETTGSAESGAARSRCAYFVSDGTNTYSISASQRHTGTLIAAGNLTACSSHYSASAIECLDHLGAVDFSATVTSLDASGFTLDVTNAMDGRMVVWAIGLGDQVIVQEESVSISEGSVLLEYQTLIVNETVTISEGDPLFMEQDATLDEPTRGNTSQGGAMKGVTAQGGAAYGHTSS